MRKFCQLLCLFSLLIPTLQAEVEQAEPKAFAALIETEDTVLVDVRTPGETAIEKLTGAMELDFYAGDFAAKILTLPREKTLLLYCRSGNRSGKAAAFLESNGYQNLVNLGGGIIAWKAAKMPVTSKKED